MKKSEVQIGQVYNMNHTSGRIQVRILRAVTRHGYGQYAKDRHHWLATNLKTGREIEVKSAVKLSPVDPDREKRIADRVNSILEERKANREALQSE